MGVVIRNLCLRSWGDVSCLRIGLLCMVVLVWGFGLWLRQFPGLVRFLRGWYNISLVACRCVLGAFGWVGLWAAWFGVLCL